jgi:hypothetical protein
MSCFGSSGQAGEEGYDFASSLAAALLDGLSEQPAELKIPLSING